MLFLNWYSNFWGLILWIYFGISFRKKKRNKSIPHGRDFSRTWQKKSFNRDTEPSQKMRRSSLVSALLIANILMATRLTLTLPFSRSISPLLSRSLSQLKQFPKSHPCPLWSSSFSFCLHTLRKSTSPIRASSSFSPSMAASSPLNDAVEGNPLLQNFDFPPFDVVEPKHVRPGIRALLGKLVTIITSSLLFSRFGFWFGFREMGRGWFEVLGVLFFYVGKWIGGARTERGTVVAKVGGTVGEDRWPVICSLGHDQSSKVC